MLALADTSGWLSEENGCPVRKKDLTIYSWIFVARKYDAAKEERFQQEAKQRELQRIEEALQTAAHRGETGFFSVFSTSAFRLLVYSPLQSAVWISQAFNICNRWNALENYLILQNELLIVLLKYLKNDCNEEPESEAPFHVARKDRLVHSGA